jgi:hypothetical protein
METRVNGKEEEEQVGGREIYMALGGSQLLRASQAITN